MTCRDIDAALVAGRELSPEVREHLSVCAVCQGLSAAMERARGAILNDLTPVRPLAPAGAYATLFLLSAAAMAGATANLAGIKGLPSLTPEQAAAVFGVLMALLLLTSFALAWDMRPGARTVRGAVLFWLGLGATEAIFLTLFHNFTPGNFMHWGFGCLSMGLVCSAVTALLAWLPLRRGYVVARASTGAAIGALAGVAGLMALELHCPILNVPHLAVWHAGVLAVSIGVGWVAGRVASSRRR